MFQKLPKRIRGYEVYYERDGQVCRFTHPEGGQTRWMSVHRNKSGNFDRSWLLRALRELVNSFHPLGSISPAGINFIAMAPTTGGVQIRRRNP